ncbi:MAG TPA: zinc ribbon domain-containing protein [bacterium]|jgi:RNA polymerase subunit RPABC4/transcription elongation factor Spt4
MAATSVNEKISLQHDEEIVDAIRVRFTINRVIAQDGRLYLTNHRILFSPIGVLDRVVGAGEIAIFHPHVQRIDVQGEQLSIQSRARIYRFTGKQVALFAEQAERLREGTGSTTSAPPRASANEATVTSGTCPTCEKEIRSDFIFCPYCQEQLISPVCGNCHRLVEESWTFCPTCRCAIL